MAFGELGATFIKLGQALSTRSDFLPRKHVAEFSKLQDPAPPVPFDAICQIICAELGQPPEEAFVAFDAETLASASFGQAHAARLKSGEALSSKSNGRASWSSFIPPIWMMPYFTSKES